ncbi:uncharacterized protein DS421_15g493340 [Arachis hypogaea]|nr:uncharacterized protein DS421_15g493340 [Arachis hypogaea]
MHIVEISMKSDSFAHYIYQYQQLEKKKINGSKKSEPCYEWKPDLTLTLEHGRSSTISIYIPRDLFPQFFTFPFACNNSCSCLAMKLHTSKNRTRNVDFILKNKNISRDTT